MTTQTEKPRGFMMPSVYKALFGDFPRGLMNWWRVAFSDKEAERDFQKYLVDNDLPKERMVNFLCVIVYALFAILDIIAVREQLFAVLALRLAICAPLALIITFSTYLDRVKPYFQLATAGVVMLGSMSIVVMIGMMGPEEGPAYIVGILTVLIVYSCLQRLYFPLAAAIYITIFASYSLTITVISPKPAAEVAAGHFFMIVITLTAFVTSYVQEARARIDYHRRRQREMDAAFIEKLLIEATAADRAKISFLSILSHELRTPLHQIVGFSEVVKNQVLHDSTSDPSSYLDQIHTSATSLLTSISKMLRYADATAGKITYDVMDCSVNYLMETVTEQMRSKAESAKIIVDASALENAVLHIDHLHTAYAIGQLLDNAIAASSPGGAIEVSGCAEADGRYRLNIIDHGTGMSEDQITSAFAPFVQTEDVKTRTMEGVGLGLSLSKKIVEDQGAELILNSEVGLGTTACVLFPMADKKAEDPEKTDAA
ncbi:MAG: HAMP domain-containing sensor histidine kinase [Pseudomonadota bacterium]